MMAGFDEKLYEKTVVPRLLGLQRRRRTADAFLRYGLDLEEDDTARIKEQMASVQAYWARNFKHPRDGLLYKTLHADSATGDKLKDPERRALLRTSIQEERANEERERLRDLDEEIALAASEGHLTPRGAAALIKRMLDQGYAEELVRRRMAGLEVRETQVATLPEGLPDTTMAAVDTALTALGFPDLYTYLGLPANADAGVWTSRYNEEAEKVRKQGKGPRTEAANKLLSVVKGSLLKDPTLYAKGRIRQLARELEPRVVQVGIEGSISARGYEGLRRAALALGIPSPDDVTVVRWLAQKNNIPLPPHEQSAPISLCPQCRKAVVDPGKQEICPHCAFALWTRCPECGQKAMTGASCATCGYPLQRDEDLKRLLAQGEKKLQARDLHESFAWLEQMERVWLRGRVAGFRDRLEAVQAEFEGFSRKFREAMTQHKPFEARDWLDKLRPVGAEYTFHDGGTIEGMQTSLDGVMKALENILVSARTYLARRECDQAVMLFERAWAMAQDSVEARKGLLGCPPEPPLMLLPRVHPASITLTWTASPSKGSLEYVVAWRRDRAPSSIADADGSETVQTGGVAWEHASVAAGTTLFYAVFCKRGEALSKGAISGPVVAAFEVVNLKAVAREDRIEGSWNALPAGARALATRRTVGASGGWEAIASSASGFIDSSVSGSGRYEYRVAVEYATAAGARRTAGLTAVAEVEKRLEPATELRVVSRGSNQREISWKPPAQGGVEIFAFPALPYRPGVEMERSAWVPLFAHNLRLGGSPALWTRKSNDPLFVTAVTFLGERALMGPSVLDVEDISHIAGNDLQTALELLWSWPAGCTAAMVCWRYDRYPVSPTEPGNSLRSVSRGEYNVARRFVLENPPARKHFFTVFAGYAIAAGPPAYAPGTSAGCQLTLGGPRRTPVTFTIEKHLWRRGRALRLTIQCGGASTALPEMRLVFKRGGPSVLSLIDGEEIVTIRAKVSPFPYDFELSAPGFLGVFLVKDADREKYQIVASDPSQLDWTR